MRRITAAALMFFLFLGHGSAAAQAPEGLQVAMRGHFSFLLPEEFELDASATGEHHIMLVPAGTVRDEEDVRELPEATFTMVADVGQPGNYAKLGADLPRSDEEVAELNATLESGFVGEARSRGDMTDIKWHGTQIVQLEQTQAIRFRFTGKLPNQKSMISNVYMIQNNDTMYYLTLSAVDGAMEAWVPAFNAVLGSLEFEVR